MKEEKKDFHALGKMSKEELRVLSSDIRADILSACLSNGGHLSSNLGAVELTLSLLKNLPPDENDILFDVGHQAYCYKMMTGRDIKEIRKTDGVSPFNLREESPYDVYSNGHAGDCLSTAIGIAKAKLLSQDESYTIAFVGDASIENGISYEALDFLASHKELKRLIVILNDNGMAISKNNGPLSKKFNHLRNSRFYFRTSSKLGRKMEKHKWTWKMFLKMRSIKDHLKGFLLSSTLFEALGLKYIGPYDGHDFSSLDLGFEKAKFLAAKQPVILHFLTRKGYGYPQAMKDEKGDFHGVGKNFDQKTYDEKNLTFTSLKQSLIYGPMKQDEKIIILTPAMEKGSGLELLFEDFPSRCIDTGISEEHALVMASGLAIKGYKPILDIYATFLQRDYDEIIENVSRNHIPLLFFVERAGIVGEDGSSHQGIYDVGMVKNIPGRKVWMPFDANSLQLLLLDYEKNPSGPTFIRFPKGNPVFHVPPYTLEHGVCFFNRAKNKKLFIGISCMGYELLTLLDETYDKMIMVDLLMEEEDLDFLDLTQYETIYFYDGYQTRDGTECHLECYLLSHHFKGQFVPFAFERKFIRFGQIDDILKSEGMDVSSVYEKIRKNEEAKK